MALDVPEVVIGATGMDLLVTVTDENGDVLDISGALGLALQGTSPDLPSKTLNVAGVVYDGPQGVAKWSALGGTGYVTTADMGQRDTARFGLRVKYTDSSNKVRFGPLFYMDWVKWGVA